MHPLFQAHILFLNRTLIHTRFQSTFASTLQHLSSREKHVYFEIHIAFYIRIYLDATQHNAEMQIHTKLQEYKIQTHAVDILIVEKNDSKNKKKKKYISI